MKELDKLVAFTMGKKGPVVYLVTDPQCPYCKKAEEVLFPMAENGDITLKVLLFPLPFHKGAKEECISIICDKKGGEGLKNRYRSENQCDMGKKKVEDTISYLRKKGISGTPTHIFQDGRFQSGVMQKEALLQRLSSGK
jgi:thiol:disulfide interchange protein DsbC